MIELTEEQLAELKSVIYNNLKVLAGKVELDVIAYTVLEDLKIDQIKQLAEKHNASLCEWFYFDADDENTHPKFNQRVLVETGIGVYQGNFHPAYTCPEYGITDEAYFEFCTDEGWEDDFLVSRWCHLPQPPK